MRKIFAFIAASALFAGCQDNMVDDLHVVESLSAPLTLSVGQGKTRSFDDELKWSWETTDEIVGYQNAGDKIRNTLSLVEGNMFYCGEFAYATEDMADFHFFYADEDATTKALTAVQDGTWRPVLVGTATETTHSAIDAVEMEHLSAALEVRVWQGPQENPTARTVTAAVLSSAEDFVGKWSVNDDLSYEQMFDGTEISLTGLDTSTVVFNMPVNEEGFAADAFTLTLTHDGTEYDYSLPALTFVAGKRTVVNIIVATAANLSWGRDFRDNDYIPDNATSVLFVANSSVNEGDNLADSGSKYPIYKVVNGGEVEFHTPADKFMANADCMYMFNGKSSLQTINLTNVDTSEVTTMESMFDGCESLTSLTFGNSFDTSNVTRMYRMFSDCSSLTELDLSGFDTSNVTSMSAMFSDCSLLEEIDLSGFDTSEVTAMDDMFRNCESLKALDLSGFDTSNVTYMSKMFSGCSSLTELDLGSFNTEKVESMSHMFSGCSLLTELDLSNFSTESVLRMENMFSGCYSITELDIRGFDMYIQSDIKVQGMFSGLDAKIYVSSDTEQYFIVAQRAYGEHYLGSTYLEFVVV